MNSDSVENEIKSALALQQAGKLNEAKDAYEQIITRFPAHPDAYHLLGLLFFEAGHTDQGTALAERSVEMAPDNPAFLSNLASIYDHIKHHQKAVKMLSRAGQIGPLSPQQIATLCHSLIALGDFKKAKPYLERLLDQIPEHAVALRLMGRAHMGLGHPNEALSFYQKALDVGPNASINHYNLGNALVLRRELDGAQSAYRHALARQENLAEAHTGLGEVLMLQGHLAEGWPEYEWRWKGEGFPNTQAPGPLWDGRAMDGETLLLTTEQGYGDAFQFVRFANLAKQRSQARVVVEAQSAIADLIATAPGVDAVIERGAPLPAHTAQAPLMTLPMILGTTLDTIPADTPYLHVDQALRAQWAKELADLKGLKVGLVWRGNPHQLHNVYRSCPVDALTPLFEVPGVSWVGLQKDPTDDELAALPDLVDFGRRVKTFSDTAAIQAELDLVVSVCTSTAHLAGALARPLWVMLSAGSDWRWFLDRTDSPWYPSATLFRQTELHDWASVVEDIAQALRDAP